MAAERYFSIIGASGEIEVVEEKAPEFVGCPTSDTGVEPTPVESRHAAIQCLLNFRGYFLTLASNLSFVCASVCVRKASFFTGGEQSIIRYMVGLFIMLVWAYVSRINILGEKDQRRMLIFRGIFGVMSLVAFISAIKLIAPTDVLGIYNSAVIWVAILARIFLKEKLTIMHIIATLLIFVGILFISQPSFIFTKVPTTLNNSYNVSETLNDSQNSYTFAIGFGITLFGSFAVAVMAILVKILQNNKAHITVPNIYASFFGIPVSLVLTGIFLYTGVERQYPGAPDITVNTILPQILFSVVASVSSLCGNLFCYWALKFEDASKVAVLRSTEVLFMFVFQYLFLDIKTNIVNIIGVMLISAASFMLIIQKFAADKYASIHATSAEHTVQSGDNETTYHPTEAKTCSHSIKKIFFYKF